jgi:hypothetical protein
MNRIIRWIRALRLGRRDKRVEVLGGHPGQGPNVQIEHFEPTLDQAGRVQRILGGVSQLGPESVDEATGHPLDNLINAQGDEWRRKLRQQYHAYRPAAYYRLRQANAIVEQYQQLREDDLMRLRSAEIAVETALLALSGPEAEPAAGSERASRQTPAPGRPTPSGRAEAAQPGRPGAAYPDSAQADWLGLRAALAAHDPPKASRSELRRLLEPQDARRVPRWGDRGFRDGTLLAGRPRSAYLHAFALLLAAGADVGAFVQVVELVLPSQDWVIWLVVSGLTSVVLYIAHMVGVMIREAKADHSTGGGLAGRMGAWLGRRFAAFVCTAIWLAVGLMVFWVRYTVPLPGTAQLGGGGIGSGGIGSGGIGSGGIGSGSTSVASTSSHLLQAAAIFLGLYLATGIVAAVGAYFTHNPYRGRYAAAIRAYRKASERAAASAYQLGMALAVRDRQQAEIDAAAHVLAEAQVQNNAFAQQLKQSARIEIASVAKDPAVTDAIFEPDQSPYQPDPEGPPPDREEPGVPTP